MHGWWFIGGSRKFGKGKNMLIKHDIPRYIDMISGNMKTFVSFMKRAIAKKDTLFGSKLHLAFVIWTEVWLASTPKNLEKGVFRLFIKANINGSLHVQNTSGSTVYEKTCSGESITPKPKWNRYMGQKSRLVSTI